ncbi:unnamed protein product [Discula destructiva]
MRSPTQQEQQQEKEQETEQAADKGFLGLPDEILLQVLSFLDPSETTNLQLTCKQLLGICRDDTLWRSTCFEESNFAQNLRRRQMLLGRSNDPLADAPDTDTDTGTAASTNGHMLADARTRERKRIMANWDPSYRGETVNWYDEYIQRNATVAVNWLQQSALEDGPESTRLEARGLALYRPDNPHQDPYKAEDIFAVSALEDGSVCLWDVTGARGKKGAIYAKSKPGILFIDGPSAASNNRSKRIDTNVTEVVSVDSKMHLAFFAVQSHLIEVDLRSLRITGWESFPWSITTLSATDPATPLTVGTNRGIHLHDFRSRNASSWKDASERLEGFGAIGSNKLFAEGLKALFDTSPLPPYAPLAHPAPLSILHMHRPGAEADMADEIYVAGRFPSVLLYDRRMFPSIKGSIHSGARLSSLAALPFSYSPLDSELRKEGEMSIEQVERSKAKSPDGRTLLAFGEYKTKGSLEMYGLLPSPTLPASLPGGLSNSVFKNRQTASDSKILSGTTQGTRLVFSDGSGWIKWFERDGFTEVRRESIGHCVRDQQPSLFVSMPGSGDIARKLLPTQDQSTGKVNDNDLLFWTGENLGMVTFTAAPGFTPEDFEEDARSAAEKDKEREERVYGLEMRRALERQADDVRFVRNLGLRV